MAKAQLARRMVLASLLGSSAAPTAGPNNRASARVSQDTNGEGDEYECESSRGSKALIFHTPRPPPFTLTFTTISSPRCIKTPRI
eukprot:CAMPEP_0198109052 /NCGR_PEP_ID=MMETSP1442-20131203/1073_1 /TAXON_ID= /ORGANISM="Craspedostauros australis, Strain CCMP3328" /LENGTH=84 /DNA_ID=CAMNT_0043764533 /DNA_START=99 /DNA_END=353 /DNA_ORIENTATION=+